MNNTVKPVVFEPQDFKVVKEVQTTRNLGDRGFSIAVRQIIREWAEMKAQCPANQNAQNQPPAG